MLREMGLGQKTDYANISTVAKFSKSSKKPSPVACDMPRANRHPTHQKKTDSQNALFGTSENTTSETDTDVSSTHSADGTISSDESSDWTPKRNFRRERVQRFNDMYRRDRRDGKRVNQADDDARTTTLRNREKLFNHKYKTRINNVIANCGSARGTSEEDVSKHMTQFNIQYCADGPQSQSHELLTDASDNELAYFEINYNMAGMNRENGMPILYMPKRKNDLLYCTIKVKYDNTKIRCLIDTGACASLIRKDAIGAAIKFVGIHEQPIKLIAWNDSENIIKEYVNLVVKIGRRTFTLKFHVVPTKLMGSQKCILGKDILVKLGIWKTVDDFLRERLM